jgi:hypothetical protein
MRFDYQPGTDGDRTAKKATTSVRSRRTVMMSGWLVATAVAGAMAVASCGSLSSGDGTKDAGSGGSTGTGGVVTSSGGATGAGGMATSMGGSGTGGSPVDAAVDAPETDTPAGDVGPTDNCPNDPNKTDPGQCGCGMPDTDTDGDGVADCIDQCPMDPGKFATGLCGCGVPDVNTNDTDGDGTLDCLDQCPRDPTRTKAGVCGCGVSDTAPLCLAHRYQFNDVTPTDGGVADGGDADAGSGSANPPGTVIKDSVGTADGVAVRATLNGSGSVTLVNGTTNVNNDQYIQLPSHLISSLGNSATFEAWVNWAGGANWQRIFDFGGNQAGTIGTKTTTSTGSFFIFVTPQGGVAPNGTFVSFVTAAGSGVNEVSAPTALASGSMQHVAVVVDDNTGDGGAPSVILYVNGVRVSSVALSNLLSNIPDDNNWLGRSQFGPDPSLSGTYYEFRIYSSARTAAQIMASFTAGPDALPAN